MTSETRQNLLAIAIGLGISALIFAFFLRPAVVLPVGSTVLENSIGVQSVSLSPPDADRHEAECREVEGAFECKIWRYEDSGGATAAPFVVQVGSAGCWVARPERGRGSTEGCINLTDYFGF